MEVAVLAGPPVAGKPDLAVAFRIAQGRMNAVLAQDMHADSQHTKGRGINDLHDEGICFQETGIR